MNKEPNKVVSALDEAELIRMRIQVRRAFRPSAPIDQVAFFSGRIDQVSRVLGAISQAGRHVILYGERGVGKTSLANLIHEFWNDAFKDEDILVTPRITCDSTDTFESIWVKVLEAVHSIYDKRGWEFPPSNGHLQSAAHDLSNYEATPTRIKRFLDLCEKLFVIIIDEFDRLEDPQARKLFADTIKTLSDDAIDATLILVGVADTVDELIEDHASVDRALEQVLMPRMSVDELKKIVERGLQTVGMTFESDVPILIATLSQGLPHYTHLLGLHASGAALENGRTKVTKQDVRVAQREAVTQAQQTVQNAYHKATTSARDTLYPQVLLACALAPVDDAGYFAPVDVREPLSKLLKKDVHIPTYIKHLHLLSTETRGCVLQKTGPDRKIRYRFADPMLKPYLMFRALQEGILDEATIEVHGERTKRRKDPRGHIG